MDKRKAGKLAPTDGDIEGFVLPTTKTAMQLAAAVVATAPRQRRKKRARNEHLKLPHVNGPGEKLARSYEKNNTSIYGAHLLRVNEGKRLMTKAQRKAYNRGD